MQDDPLLKLAIVFAPLSLAAVGGILSILAGVQHQTVDVQGWMTGREFIELFAISRGVPGPGIMLITLIGWKVAGWLGAGVGIVRDTVRPPDGVRGWTLRARGRSRPRRRRRRCRRGRPAGRR